MKGLMILVVVLIWLLTMGCATAQITEGIPESGVREENIEPEPFLEVPWEAFYKNVPPEKLGEFIQMLNHEYINRHPECAAPCIILSPTPNGIVVIADCAFKRGTEKKEKEREM